MQRNGPPLFLLLAALLAVSPSAHDILQHSEDGKALIDKAEKTNPEEPAKDRPNPAIRKTRSGKELARLYEQFFGKPVESSSQSPVSKNPKAHTVTLTSQESGRSTLKLEVDAPEEGADPKKIFDDGITRTGCSAKFLIALVPDPLDSSLAISFDQAVSAIQMAFADAGYLPDRFWLPWRGDAAQNKEYRTHPGILLFRKEAPVPPKEGLTCVLSTVFLVGETPKIGIQKEAFGQAVSLVDELTGATNVQEVPKPQKARKTQKVLKVKEAEKAQEVLNILGPSFSGSITSLGFLLQTDVGCQSNGPRCRIHLITGTTSSPQLEQLSKGLNFEMAFQSKATQGPELISTALKFLRKQMGWDLSRTALLYEADTTYGALGKLSDPDDTLVYFPFPSGLSEMRVAWEEKNGPGEDLHAGDSKLGIPRRTLDLSLAEHAEPVDTVQEFSSLTTRNKDLAIANLLTAISRDGLRYIGILATDPRDIIFLARRIKTFAPDVILFTIDNNLLYTHPTYQEFTDEMLVLCNYPLVTESEHWGQVLNRPTNTKHYRQQFMTEFQQGIFEAAKALILKDTTPQQPLKQQSPKQRIWIAAIGNGSLWPIVSLPETSTRESAVGDVFEPHTDRRVLQLLYLGIVVVGLGWFTAAHLRQLAPASAPTSTESLSRGLLAAGLIPLWTMGATLLTIVTLFIQAEAQSFILVLAYVACSLLLWIGIYSGPPPKDSRPSLSSNLWPGWVLTALLTAILPWALRRLWMPGGAGLFQRRAHYFSSGLSPIVSLFLVCLAVWIWALLEIKRWQLQSQQGFGWPLHSWHSMNFFDDSESVDRLKKLAESTVPSRRFWGYWLFSALFLIPSGWYLFFVAQPVAETRWYGRVFIGMILLGFALAMMSFFRFFILWRTLSPILQRIDHTRIPGIIKMLSPEIAWKPMKSFAWPLPAFKMAVLSSDKLKAVLKRSEYQDFGNSEEIEAKLEDIFATHREQSFTGEREARRDLNKIFEKSCSDLKDHIADPDIMTFFAVRLVAYLRHMFAHMRYCLIGAMTSAGILLLATRTYAFEPKQFVFMSVWVLMLAAVVLTFWAFFEMDRNATLSAINGTNPGEISFDRTLVTNLLTYGALPVLGLAATQFPEIGRYFVGWLNPLLRVVGGN